jgi:peptide/nickel transport system permease protein
MTTIEAGSAPTLVEAARRASIPRRIWRMALRSREFQAGMIIFAALVLAAALYPLISSVDPTTISIKDRFFAPPLLGAKWSWQHPLGTDQLGRDMLVRSLVGLRYSLLIGLSSVFLLLIVGAAMGMVAGYYGGLVDTVIMRITDAQLAIPMIILAIAVLGVSRPTIPAIVLVLSLSGWPVYARVMRSVVMTERNREFVRAARVSGASNVRIMLKLLAPLVLPPMIFVSVLDVARMMIFESLLGFLGLGVQPPTPTFGNIIADGRKYMLNYWWIATMPGLFLCLTLTSINLMGTSLERVRNRIYGGV